MLLFNTAALYIERADSVKDDAHKQIEQLFKLYQRQLISLSEFNEQCQKVEAEMNGKLKEINRDMMSALNYYNEHCNAEG